MNETDLDYLRRAIELSRLAPSESGDLPFGALVVDEGRVISEGRNLVATQSDPTAHAEILALREAARRRGDPSLVGAVLYSSSEPCPMCLTACYWARISRVVHAATTDDAAEYGFSDAEYYRQLRLPAQRRDLRIDAAPGPERTRAVQALADWGAGRSSDPETT